jgi:hypothetical protein
LDIHRLRRAVGILENKGAASDGDGLGPDIRFEAATSGPVVKLAAVAGPDSTGDCSYQTQFTVPDVEAGTYELLWVLGAVNPSRFDLRDRRAPHRAGKGRSCPKMTSHVARP